MIEPEKTRLHRIRRRWPRHAWEGSGRTRWDGWDVGRTSLFLSTGAWLPSLYLERSLWSSGLDPWRPFDLLTRSPSGWWTLALLIVLNGWVIDRSLARRSRGENGYPSWLRWSRAVLAAVPILGLAVVPAWRWMLTHRPVSVKAGLDLRAADMASPASPGVWKRLESLLRRSSGSFAGLVLWMIACQIVPVLALLSWLTQKESWGGGRRLLVFVMCAALHLMAAVGAAVFARVEVRRRQTTGARVLAAFGLPLLLLLPFPLSVPGLLVWLPLAGESREDVTLVYAVHDRRGSRGRLLSRLAVPSAKVGTGGALGRDLPPDFGEIEDRRRSLYRLKAFLLFFEAGALGWWMHPLDGESVPPWTRPVPSLVFLVPAGLGVLLEISGLVSWQTGRGVLGAVWARHPYGRYLALTQLVFPAGWLAGATLAAGAVQSLGLLLSACGLLSLFTLFPFWVLTTALGVPGRSSVVSALWLLLFAALAISGSVLESGGEGPILTLVHWAFVSAPLVSVLVGCALGGSLVRSLGSRPMAKLLTASTLLPFGGLLVPLWIYVRHQLAPSWEGGRAEDGRRAVA